LNGGGLRVDSKEAQGLFNKTATAEGVSSNLGRRIWIERFGPDLVRTIRSARRGSGRSDLVGLAGTAGLHGGARRRRRFNFGCGLRSMIASVRGRGERADAHRGLELAGETA
jgi:hypothetical protein